MCFLTLSIELLEILVSAVAALATVSAVIYSWVLWKTKPRTWTLMGICALLYSFMLMSWASRYILTTHQPSENAIVVEVIFAVVMMVGYLMFLFGTYNAGPVRRNNAK